MRQRRRGGFSSPASVIERSGGENPPLRVVALFIPGGENPPLRDRCARHSKIISYGAGFSEAFLMPKQYCTPSNVLM